MEKLFAKLDLSDYQESFKHFLAQEAMDKNRKAIDAKRKADYDLMLNGKENDVKADKNAEANNNGGSAA